MIRFKFLKRFDCLCMPGMLESRISVVLEIELDGNARISNIWAGKFKRASLARYEDRHRQRNLAI
jgi:hypothetical protein